MDKVRQDSLIWVKVAFIALGCILSGNVIAETMETAVDNPWYKNIEFSAEVGPNWLQTNNTTDTISRYETDNVLVNNINNQIAWKVGAGYYLFDNALSSRKYFNHLLFEINVYQISGDIKGDVEQFQLPQFNNYSYHAPFTSTRLMFDLKPYLFTYKRISPYLILGIGPAWNQISYTEKIIGTDVLPNSNLVLNSHTATQFAENVGIGVSIQVSQQLSLTG
ncbi:MAG: hypothetical protein ACK4PR_08560, partial [Gammaproteobacteria bacterium]